MDEDILVIDIETKTFNKKPDAKNDEFVIAGLYSLKTKKIQLTTNLKTVQEWVDRHDAIVGHNFIEYDQPILERYGIDFKYKKILDTLVIAKKRLKPLLRIEPDSYSLGSLAEELKLNTMKGEMDFNILKKNIKFWTADERTELIKYLKGDLLVTGELFEYFYDRFIDFRQFVDSKNQKNWNWLTASSGALSYKVLCNFAELSEEYGDVEGKHEDIGGLVLTPTGEEYSDIWYMDYASLYPHIFMMFNLFGNPTLRPDCTDWFTGNDVFKIKGKYAKDRYHIISEHFQEMYNNRKKIKKTNPRLAYTYKIILNGGYGVMRSPIFKSTYYEHTGADCCRIGQTMNRLIGEFFEVSGFQSIAGDTDSRFLKYKEDIPIEQQKKILDMTRDRLLDFIKKNVPFPSNSFDLENETDDEPLKYIKFVKDNDKFLKKNYIYITPTNKVKIVGLPIKKNNATKIGKLILNKYLKPEIIKRGHANFTRKEIMNWVYAELKEDIGLASIEYKVNNYDAYKSSSNIQAQISKHYMNKEGGKIKLIKNAIYGKVGSDKWKYCTIDEAKNLNIIHLNLDKIKAEFKPFIKQQEVKSLFDY